MNSLSEHDSNCGSTFSRHNSKQSTTRLNTLKPSATTSKHSPKTESPRFKRRLMISPHGSAKERIGSTLTTRSTTMTYSSSLRQQRRYGRVNEGCLLQSTFSGRDLLARVMIDCLSRRLRPSPNAGTVENRTREISRRRMVRHNRIRECLLRLLTFHAILPPKASRAPCCRSRRRMCHPSRGVDRKMHYVTSRHVRKVLRIHDRSASTTVVLAG